MGFSKIEIMNFRIMLIFLMLMQFCSESGKSTNSDSNKDENGVQDTTDDDNNSNSSDDDNACDECYIFYTNVKRDGNLGGLDGADQLCNDKANDSLSEVQGGTFKALLSTSSVSANDASRIRDARFITSKDELVAESANDLWDGRIENFIRDEQWNGDTLFVWTGTDAQGDNDGNNCLDWTSNSSSEFGRYGYSNASIEILSWVDEFSADCSDFNNLYCVQYTE